MCRVRPRGGETLAGVSAALIALILIVFFMAFGFGLLGFALSVFWSLVWYSIVGLVIGGLGRLLVSGRQELGLVETALFGIAGALLGGIVANDVLDLVVGPVPDGGGHRGASGARHRRGPSRSRAA